MIYSLTGKLIHTEIDLAVIECAGVGYACRTTLNTLRKIQGTKENVTLLTHLSVREDNVELFGFAGADELSAFKMLITVSGVGPKAAIAVLSELTPQKFAVAVASSDVAAFKRCKGIGAKIAQRIVLELKDKISKDAAADNADIQSFVAEAAPNSVREAAQALAVLGYSQSEAVAAVSKVAGAGEKTTEEIIKLALKYLAGFIR
ncbi:MAG: Holliday junction branch migration protein RuvA [Oscillospiraceae bacterium]